MTLFQRPKGLQTNNKVEIKGLVAIYNMWKLSYDDDLPWASPAFTQIKKIGDINILIDFRKLNAFVLKRTFSFAKDWRSYSKAGEVQVHNSSRSLIRIIYHSN